MNVRVSTSIFCKFTLYERKSIPINSPLEEGTSILINTRYSISWKSCLVIPYKLCSIMVTHFCLVMSAEICEVSAWSPVEGIGERVKCFLATWIFPYKSPLHVRVIPINPHYMKEYSLWFSATWKNIPKVLQGYPERSSCKIYSIMMSLISCLPTHFWLEGMVAEICKVSAWSPVEVNERVKWKGEMKGWLTIVWLPATWM